MEKAKKNLKIWSELYIILAILDVVSLIGAYLAGQFDVSSIPKNLQTGVLIFVISVCIIMILIKLLLGVQGLRQVNGTNKGTGHITLAKVTLIFLVLILIGSVVEVIKAVNTRTITDLSSNLFSFIVIFEYIKYAKYLKENK